MSHPANQGLCRLTSLEPGFEPCKGYVWTDLIEKFPIFDPKVARMAERCIASKVPVHLRVTIARNGYAYLFDIMPIDFDEKVQACVRCGQMADRIDVGDGAPYFTCASCHHRMFLAPPRVKTA